jgi:hypothetical protein
MHCSIGVPYRTIIWVVSWPYLQVFRKHQKFCQEQNVVICYISDKERQFYSLVTLSSILVSKGRIFFTRYSSSLAPLPLYFLIPDLRYIEKSNSPRLGWFKKSWSQCYKLFSLSVLRFILLQQVL